METFETYITNERERLAKAKEDALSRRKEVDVELAAIDTELQAIAAYEQVKKGKPVRTATPTDGENKPRKPRESGKRNEVLTLVQSFPHGATRADLIDKLNIKGDKAAEQSLSNALASLKKQGHLTQTDGKYAVPAP